MEPNLESLAAQMTLAEKAALTVGANAWETVPIERLGIPKLTMSDGPHGVRRVEGEGTPEAKTLPATCFPTASALAATWNVDLLGELGRALGDECIERGVDVLLGPGVNMKRTPLCGRNFEYYSEDPCLAGELAAAWVQGLQSRGVGASLKHYAANNQEHHRFTVDARVDERTLRELYLAAFERVVTQAQPWTVMCMYNRLNGVYGSEHPWLLTQVLRDEWGFQGFVVSDWGAVHDRVAALGAGLDLEMPG
ncbi:MAG: glycoside hydrolase family 3 protein, partial [Chloroflexi bacterium]|nr:glycoside hydrolase family 3 protein [Chloroflexota bacterium]